MNYHSKYERVSASHTSKERNNYQNQIRSIRNGWEQPAALADATTKKAR